MISGKVLLRARFNESLPSRRIMRLRKILHDVASCTMPDIKRVGSMISGKVLLRARFNESLPSRRIMRLRKILHDIASCTIPLYCSPPPRPPATLHFYIVKVGVQGLYIL